MDMPGIHTLKARRGGLWERAKDTSAASCDLDGHIIWFGPDNAAAIGRAAAAILGQIDPPNAHRYTANAETFARRLKVLDAQLATTLAPVRMKPYIVFHDADHYFDTHYGLSPAGPVAVAADRSIGARRVQELRNRISESHAKCVFIPPDYTAPRVRTLTEGTMARVSVLEDLGTDIPTDPDLYPMLMTEVADTLARCLREERSRDEIAPLGRR